MKFLRKRDQKRIASHIYELQINVDKYSDTVEDVMKMSEILSDIASDCGLTTVQEVLRLLNEVPNDIQERKEDNERKEKA